MKKLFLMLIFCLVAAGSSFAQSNMEAMRFLTVNALVQYGQKLYDRGDFNQACAVFIHVLSYDAHQPQALEFLKEMGHSPAPIPKPIPVIMMKPKTPPVVIPGKNMIVVVKPDAVTLKAVNFMDTDSLKKAIEAKRQIIEHLRDQIKEMRVNIASEDVNAGLRQK